MTNPFKLTAHRMRGIGLVELMIGMTIGLFLILGVLEVFASTRASYRTQEALSRIQESGRFAVNFLSRDVRMAGYAGCVRNAPVTNTLNQSTSLAYEFTVGIQGFDNVTSAQGGITPTSGTDMFVIRRMTDNPAQVVNNNNSAQLFIQYTAGVANACPGNTTSFSGICEGDILMVTDCQKARVFQATNLQATGGNVSVNVVHSNSNQVTPGNAISSWGGASSPASEQFGPGSEIVKVVTRVYFVATGANGEPSLWMRENGAASQELVEGVEDMQILYDLDLNGDGIIDQFARTAAEVTAANTWASVTGARIELMIRSRENGVVSAVQTFPFNGASFTAPDRRLRKVFTPYITLRNRTN